MNTTNQSHDDNGYLTTTNRTTTNRTTTNSTTHTSKTSTTHTTTLSSTTNKMTLSSLSSSSKIGIVNPELAIMTPISYLQNNIYLYSKPIDFIVNLSYGTDVKVDLYIGEEELLNKFPSSTFISGAWPSPLKITRSYTYPGDYRVTAVISNEVSSFKLTKFITVMSNVSGLIVELKHSPVIFQYQSIKDVARAYFQFHYQENTCAGSHANVTFKIGDYLNSSFGPYWLGMDFNRNISKTPFFFDFNSIGNYHVNFTVSNAISSTTLFLPITISPAFYGVHIRSETSYVIPGMNVKMMLFIEQGENVTFEWFIDGQSHGVQKRLCKLSIYIIIQ